MKIIKKVLLTLCPLVFVAAILSGCHTTAGAAEDVTQTGQTVTNVATGTAPATTYTTTTTTPAYTGGTY